MKKKPYIIEILLIITLLSVVYVLFVIFRLQNGNGGSTAKAKEYSKHYALISGNMTTPFWKKVYESAKKEADANDICLEQVGSNFSEGYSLEDYLRISIASKVDGIIICPDGSEGVTELINEAASKGIPVVTILNDEAKTNRVSFVGINSYELGVYYGKQIFDQINKDTRNIYILFHSSETNTNNDVVFNQIKITLNEKLGEHHNINIQPYYMTDKNEFDSEEAIRDIFIDSATVPDILVCTEEVDTECTCQAIVDYNKVGKVTVIGSYSSDTILEAINKNLVAVTVAMDTEQLGEKSVQALYEYDGMGYANSYINVDLHIITRENVNSYIKQ